MFLIIKQRINSNSNCYTPHFIITFYFKCILYIIIFANNYFIFLIYNSIFLSFQAEDDELFWKLSCVALEKQTPLWKEESSLERLSLNNVQYSTIDSLLLMHVCIIFHSSNDHSILYLYNVVIH